MVPLEAKILLVLTAMGFCIPTAHPETAEVKPRGNKGKTNLIRRDQQGTENSCPTGHAPGLSVAYSRLRAERPLAVRTMKPGSNSSVYLCLLSLAFPGSCLSIVMEIGALSLQKSHLQHLINKKGMGFSSTNPLGSDGVSA